MNVTQPSHAAIAIERELRAMRWPVIDGPADAEFVLPSYQGRSLANVPATIGAMLGVGPVGSLAPLAPAYWQGLGSVQHVVLILLDALGWLQLTSELASSQTVFNCLAERGILLPMTSVCPSTTATALATLGTAEPPAVHGVLGYELWLREYGVLVEMLGLKPVYARGATQLTDWGWQPETFMPVPGVGTLFEQAGVRTSAHLREQFRDGALTRLCYRGFGRIIGHDGLSSLCEHLGADLAEAGGQRSYHYAYWGGIDREIHMHGADTADWHNAYHEAATALGRWVSEQLPTQAPTNTVVVICADHGFISAPEETAYAIEGSRLERELLVPQSGESRCAYLHTLGGPGAARRAELQALLGEGYAVLDAREALQAGLFGPGRPTPEVEARLGDHIAVARGQRYIDRLGRAAWMRGRHGGLTPEEMLVPWLAVRVDALV